MPQKPFCGVKCRRAWYVKWPKDCVSISAVRWPTTISSQADECSSAQLKNTAYFFGQQKKSSFCPLKNKEVDSTRRQTLGPCRYQPTVLIKPLSSLWQDHWISRGQWTKGSDSSYKAPVRSHTGGGNRRRSVVHAQRGVARRGIQLQEGLGVDGLDPLRAFHELLKVSGYRSAPRPSRRGLRLLSPLLHTAHGIQCLATFSVRPR